MDPLTGPIIGAAIEVHRRLGPGYLERVYESALAIEFEHRGIAYRRQHGFGVTYRGHEVGAGRLDLLVGDVVVEVKAVRALDDLHRAQVLAYLKATRARVGLLMNFHVPVLHHGIERFVL